MPGTAAHSPICRLPSPTVWGLQPTIGLHEHIPGHGLDRNSLIEKQSHEGRKAYVHTPTAETISSARFVIIFPYPGAPDVLNRDLATKCFNAGQKLERTVRSRRFTTEGEARVSARRFRPPLSRLCLKVNGAQIRHGKATSSLAWGMTTVLSK